MKFIIFHFKNHLFFFFLDMAITIIATNKIIANEPITTPITIPPLVLLFCNLGVVLVSLCPQFEHSLSSIPSSSWVGSFVVVQSPYVWPVASITSLTLWPQSEQVFSLKLSFVQVASFVTIHSPYLCPAVGIDSVILCPHSVQTFSFAPSLLQPGPSVTIHSPYECSVIGIEVISFLSSQ